MPVSLILATWSRSYVVGERSYGIPDEDSTDPRHVTLRECSVPLAKVAPIAPAAFVYEYDFGDGWQHLLLVEEIRWSKEPMHGALCLAGECACPPEDCGGPYGYSDFLKAISDPEHEEHEMLLTWAGGSFDPDFFDLEEANLQQVNSRYRG